MNSPYFDRALMSLNMRFLISIVYTSLCAVVLQNVLTEKYKVCIVSMFHTFLRHNFYKFIKVYCVGMIRVNLERILITKSSLSFGLRNTHISDDTIQFFLREFFINLY